MASSDFGTSQSFVGAIEPSGVARWRVLRLSESVEKGTWAQNTTPVRVISASQDNNGWITLSANNPSPAATLPEDYAYLTWRPRDVFGRVVDPGMLGGGYTGVLQMVLERDDTVWPGGYGEIVGCGVCDGDGDLTDSGTQIMGIGVLTPSADASNTIIAGIRGSATTTAGVTAKYAFGVFTIPPTQFVNVTVGGLDANGTATGGAHKDNTPSPCSGERRLWVGFGATTNTNHGTIPVKFRVHYRILPAGDLP